MPAKSKAQQKFMGMVHAAQKGEKPASKEVAKVAKSMPKKAAKDFASTKHKGLPKKVKEATDTVEKDEKGNVKSWKHEGDWVKSNNKEGRGKVTNLSDKARRQTEKMTKKEKDVAEATITQGPNKGKQWSPKTPGPTNPNYKPFDKTGVPSPDDGATAPPPKARPVKKAEVDIDDQPETSVAEGKKKMSKVKAEMKKNKIKALKENIKLVSKLLAEAKKASKGDGNLANNAKPYDKVTRGDVIAGRLGKDEMGGKKKKDKKVAESKAKCTCEEDGKSKCAEHGKKKDTYMESLFIKLQNQLNG